MPSESSSIDVCGKPHPEKGWPCTRRAGLFHMMHATSGGHPGHNSALYWDEGDSCPPACAEAHTYSSSCVLRATGPCDCRYRHGDMPGGIHEDRCRTQRAESEDPPLTPEEEERLAAKWDAAQAEHEEETLPPPEGPEHGPCVCGHDKSEHNSALFRHCPKCLCLRYRPQPEEEEELPPPEGPEYTPCVCGHTEPEHAPDAGEGECWANNCECPAYRTKPDFELPPQPERRPPHAYAYSVQGHLYEVALSGDATVVAQDGALIITHSLGPIAGIVQARPLEGERN